MAQPSREPVANPSGRLAALRARPVLTAVMIGCAAAGLVLGVTLLPEGWPLARRVLGGVLGGAGVGLMVTASRMIG
jgi:hypothetical protein